MWSQTDDTCNGTEGERAILLGKLLAHGIVD